LNDEKMRQALGPGRLGWSLGKIEEAAGIRRGTAEGPTMKATKLKKACSARQTHTPFVID